MNTDARSLRPSSSRTGSVLKFTALRVLSAGTLSLCLFILQRATLPRELSLAVTRALMFTLELILISVVWPAPEKYECSSANMGARFFGGMLLLLSAAVGTYLPGVRWPADPVLPKHTDWSWLLAAAGAALTLLALLLHRLVPPRPTRPAVVITAATVLQRRQGQYGTLTVTPWPSGGDGAMLIQGRNVAFLAVQSDVTLNSSNGQWWVPLPQDGPSPLLGTARRMSAKPLVLARRGTLDPNIYLTEVLLALPYTVIFGNEEEQLQAVAELAAMGGELQHQANAPAPELPAAPASSAEELNARQAGVEVEGQQLLLVRQNLPLGWSMRQNVVLYQGGDADLELTRPDGRVFVVDIKLRRDDPDQEDPGSHRKSWAQLAGQVRLAARQLRASPLLWQPLAAPRLRTVQGIPVLGGSTEELFSYLSS